MLQVSLCELRSVLYTFKTARMVKEPVYQKRQSLPVTRQPKLGLRNLYYEGCRGILVVTISKLLQQGSRVASKSPGRQCHQDAAAPHMISTWDLGPVAIAAEDQNKTH